MQEKQSVKSAARSVNAEPTSAAESVFPKFGPDARASAHRPEFGECGEGATAHVVSTRNVGESADSEGTPSSNTVPSNDNPPNFKPLRFGIDSLYLSYRGQLTDEWNLRLDELKTQAQSSSETEQAQAQLSLGAHLFEVRDKGVPRFPYVLADNCFFIKINRQPSKTLPMAHVQISSEYLAAVGLVAAELDLRNVIETLGKLDGAASVSRADLFLDFVCSDNLANIEQTDWIARASLMAKYYDCRLPEPFTGWVIGMGGNLHARLYEKVVEIVNKSHKTYLFELWQANGWQSGKKVWRIEFQTEKQTLKELGILSLPDLMAKQATLWHYLTSDWLRLSVPNPADSKRDRWPNHPLWEAISGIYRLSLDQPRLKRFRPARLPADERLFVHGLGGLTSFMASRGIEDFGEGLGEYLQQAKEFHHAKGEAFHHYVGRKVKAKGRKFNTLNNQTNLASTSRQLAQEVDAYRLEKDETDGDA